jgi:hypothetical protein
MLPSAFNLYAHWCLEHRIIQLKKSIGTRLMGDERIFYEAFRMRDILVPKPIGRFLAGMGSFSRPSGGPGKYQYHVLPTADLPRGASDFGTMNESNAILYVTRPLCPAWPPRLSSPTCTTIARAGSFLLPCVR